MDPLPLAPAGPATPTAPACRAREVTPDDEAVIGPTRGLWVGTAGDLVVLFAGDTAPVTLPNVGGGTLLPVSVAKVLSATTAGGIVALF